MSVTETSGRLGWWLEARFGLSLHWGLYSIPGEGEWVRAIRKMTVQDYQPYFESFSPDPNCCREWARLARQTGAAFMVLTTKHHDGFCLFDSRLTDYTSVKAPRCRRDLVREYVQALRDEGLKVGFYYSLVDWHHPDYGPVYGDRQHPLRHDPQQKQLDRSRDWSRYISYMHGQVQELLSNYGTIDLLYFDFSYWDFAGEKWCASDLMRMVRRLQPHIITNDRLGYEAIKRSDPPDYVGDFDHAEQNLPREPVRNRSGKPVPWEGWFTISNSWSHSRTDTDYKSPATLVRALVNCVSKDGNMCLNIPPDEKGHISPEVIAILQTLGQWMQKNGESLRGCVSAPLEKPEWGRWTLSRDGRYLYAHILDQQIGHICLKGLRGRVKNPIVLNTGQPAYLTGYWNPGIQTFDSPDDIFLNFSPEVARTYPLSDPLDTVVRFEVINDPDEIERENRRLDEEYARAISRQPLP
ncbi:MAG: alpha-L-fucosidase [Phycisphaerae bacterium]|jgi:alpha-L-fucosidase|nr:MAG: alpha-L-fucosidase [Phycisphaerae bacterium]